MMFTKIVIALSLFVVLAGCGEKPADTGTVEAGPTNQSAAPAASTTQTPTGEKATMAKCEVCSKEVPADELKKDHGKMTCKKCVESHGH